MFFAIPFNIYTTFKILFWFFKLFFDFFKKLSQKNKKKRMNSNFSYSKGSHRDSASPRGNSRRRNSFHKKNPLKVKYNHSRSKTPDRMSIEKKITSKFYFLSEVKRIERREDSRSPNPLHSRSPVLKKRDRGHQENQNLIQKIDGKFPLNFSVVCV